MRLTSRTTSASTALSLFILSASLSTSVNARKLKLPSCARSCIVPEVCTKKDFCSSACFGNCLVPTGLSETEGCSSALDQQLLIKACEGRFDPPLPSVQPEAPIATPFKTPVADIGPPPAFATAVLSRESVDNDEKLPAAYRDYESAETETRTVRKAAAKSQAPPLEEEEETEEDTGASGRTAILSVSVFAAALLSTAFGIAVL